MAATGYDLNKKGNCLSLRNRNLITDRLVLYKLEERSKIISNKPQIDEMVFENNERRTT